MILLVAREAHGLGLSEIAELFGRSLRTVSSLHHRYRSDFFAPEEQVEFRRQVAAMLAKAPMSAEGIVDAFPKHGSVEVAAALDERGLRRAGRADRTRHELGGDDL